MKKRNWIIAMLLGMALTLAGCGEKEEAAPEQEQTQTENTGTEAGESKDQGEDGEVQETRLVKLG